MKYLIIDCFVDEPACFGVPPFIAPYPRYVFGAMIDAGISPEHIRYLTIDSLRQSSFICDADCGLAVIIGGAVVPGKYIGARIGTLTEINKIIAANSQTLFFAGGQLAPMLRSGYRNLVKVPCDLEKYLHNHLRSNEGAPGLRSESEIMKWAVKGASVVKQHPFFPDVICEIESGRGCPRSSHCSFCSEGLSGPPEFRLPESIIAEIEELILCGVKRFRIGKQADILQYRTEFKEFKNGFSRPSPRPVAELFNPLRRMKDEGRIEILNIDNGNPGTIVNFPDESAVILETISGALSPGDTLALGIESFDPVVVSRNNLKVDMDGAVTAIKLVNQIGGRRIDSIPVLLPGVNLIHGLPGESLDTFKINYDSLMSIMDLGLLVRRINIRKLLPYPGTRASYEQKKVSPKIRNRYEFFRDKIRSDIERKMLSGVFPAGTTLKRLKVYDVKNAYSYARQISSYAISCKIPESLETGLFLDALVAGHEERSLLVLPLPLNINTMSPKSLELIPGIGRKKAIELLLKRPFNGSSDVKLTDIIDSIDKEFRRNIRAV